MNLSPSILPLSPEDALSIPIEAFASPPLVLSTPPLTILSLTFLSVRDMPIEEKYAWSGAEDDEYYCIPSPNVILFYAPVFSTNNPTDFPVISENFIDESIETSDSSLNFRQWVGHDWNDEVSNNSILPSFSLPNPFTISNENLCKVFIWIGVLFFLIIWVLSSTSN